jgi:hypothetical protein
MNKMNAKKGKKSKKTFEIEIWKIKITKFDDEINLKVSLIN